MIRRGLLCRSCTASKCMDQGEDIEIECPACDGAGCEECSEAGHFVVDGCLNQYCRQIVPAVELIDLYHQGLPPIAGGSLDQAAWFIEAARWLKSEENRIKAETHAE